MRTGKIKKLIISFLLIAMLLPGMAAAKEYVIGELKSPVEMPASGATYVGADMCRACHPDNYNDWKTTGHAYKLTTPEEALEMRTDLPFPDGYTKDDILYVIGGWGWKARYIGLDGYIITRTGTSRDIDGKNQYNIATKEWSDYNAGKTVKYDCTKCHNTGSSYESNQDNLPGMEGSWEFRGVQCEACHGPASEHVAQMGGKGVAIIVNRSSAFCGQCHRRGGDDDKIPASGNFVQHHEQYLDLLSSGKMSQLNCVDCHDPHKPVHVGATNPEEGKGINASCESCHEDIEAEYEGTVMQKEGVTCVQCHMPKAGKSAVSVSEYEADVRSHIFVMNLSPDAQFIYTDPADNKQYANHYLTMEYVCLPCHEDKDKAWAVENAPEAMTLQPQPAATKPSPGFGVVLTVVLILAMYFIRRR